MFLKRLGSGIILLAAAIVLFYTGSPERGEVSNALREKLPPYMLPAKTVLLNEMPLNKNGKIDRTVLSARI